MPALVKRRQVIDGAWQHRNSKGGGDVMLCKTRSKGWGLFAARGIPKNRDLAYFRMLVHDAQKFNAQRFVQLVGESVTVDERGELQHPEHGPKKVMWEGRRPKPGPRFVDALTNDDKRAVLDDGSAFLNPLLNTNNCYTMEVYDQYERRPRPELIMDVFGRSHGVDKGTGVPYWGHFANEPSAGEAENAKLVTLRDPRGRSPQPGDVIEVRLVSRRAIRPTEEIMWSYGAQYDRPYASGPHAASMRRAVQVVGEREDGRFRVRWSDGKHTWEPADKMINEEAVALVTEFRRKGSQ